MSLPGKPTENKIDEKPNQTIIFILKKSMKNPIKQLFLFFISLNLKLVTHLSIILMVILHA